MSALNHALNCPRCPTQGSLRYIEVEARWRCRCGFSFTTSDWNSSPHTDIQAFLYDRARNRMSRLLECADCQVPRIHNMAPYDYWRCGTCGALRNL